MAGRVGPAAALLHGEKGSQVIDQLTAVTPALLKLAEDYLEMPTLAGKEMVAEMLTGAFPALAPGTMALLGLIGLLLTWRHPALESAG